MSVSLIFPLLFWFSLSHLYWDLVLEMKLREFNCRFECYIFIMGYFCVFFTVDFNANRKHGFLYPLP